MSLSASNLKYWGYSSAVLAPADLIQPLFIAPHLNAPEPLESLPGMMRNDIKSALTAARRAESFGIRAVIPYALGLPRDSSGRDATRHDGPLASLIVLLRRELPELYLIADLCLCQFTDHGQCGELLGGEIDNDRTLHRLTELAVILAESGADAVMPSGMMDGAVGAVRRALDRAGFARTAIFSQAAKVDSGLYGPFRRASAGLSAAASKASYQVTPENSRQAAREAKLDADEGADVLVVKPTFGSADLITLFHRATELPIAAYCTGGEFAISGMGRSEPIRREDLAPLYAAKRAGASMIVSYAATAIAEALGGPCAAGEA